MYLIVHWRGIITLLVPLIAIGILVPFPPEKWQWTAYCLLVMAIYWVTECIPLPVTAFLPVIVFPFTGVMTTAAVCKCYVSDAVIMFIGSLMLAASVEQSGLHRRMAFVAIRSVGYSHRKLLVAMTIVTSFCSMWITNTAATTMMMPIIFAVLKVFEDQKLLNVYDTDQSGSKVASDIASCYFCTATFAATIGGVGTLIGTGTNLVFKGLFVTEYPTAPDYLSFPLFSAFGIPYMIALDIFMILYILILYTGLFRPNSSAAKKTKIPDVALKAAEDAVAREYAALGKTTFWEKVSFFIAREVNHNPLMYCIASGFAASHCFLLPVGTPGNLIVQSAAKVPTAKMAKAGLGPTVTTIIITWLFVYFYAPLVWPILKNPKPDWIA
ncbi:unnamed protein product [Danaus chrysippus]|uniref:(African queen) hypothetical protein n=1 Tax=Danaus chrysippus TaxID=151541 RepID=A0A8J2WBT0_9NEOP|nr:unnamed protein product [Danaus chrysippus]